MPCYLFLYPGFLDPPLEMDIAVGIIDKTEYRLGGTVVGLWLTDQRKHIIGERGCDPTPAADITDFLLLKAKRFCHRVNIGIGQRPDIALAHTREQAEYECPLHLGVLFFVACGNKLFYLVGA